MREYEFWVAAVAVVAASLLGCERPVTLVPVEGTVTLDNKPLIDATVAFSPTRANGPGPFVGTTDAQGRYALGPVGKAGSGAAVDTYMVMITTVKPDPNFVEGSPTPKDIVPMAYRDGSQRIDVPEGGKTDANFDIKTR